MTGAKTFEKHVTGTVEGNGESLRCMSTFGILHESY